MRYPPSTITSAAEAATEQSEGVTEVERPRTPGNFPTGRALGASGIEPWARPGGLKFFADNIHCDCF